MTDIFNEVDEEVRSARVRSTLVRAWPYAAGLVAAVLVVGGGVWAWRAQQNSAAGHASETYASAMQALQRNDTAGADRQFGELAHSAPGAYRTLALMQQAGIRLDRKDGPAAVQLLDQAASAAPNVLMADAAKLQAAYAVMDTGDYAAAHDRLEPLAGSGRPYRMMAREALGMAELASGRTAEAKGDLQLVSLSGEASDQARTRAGAALALIQSGTASSVPAIAKAAVGLSPQAAPPGLPRLQGGAPVQGAAPAQAQPGAAQ